MPTFSFAFKQLIHRGPTVSIIVPIYNKAKFLRQCLESIAKQSFKNIEVICVDDCSSDSSPDIAVEFAQHDGRFRIYRSENHMGAGLARNKGIDMARGEFLQFVDADDVLPLNAIAKLYRLIESGDVNIARGGVAYFDKKGINSITHTNLPPEARLYRFADEPSLWTPWYHTTYLFSRKMLRQNNIKYPNLADGEDPVFLARALTTADVLSSTKDIVYYYRWEYDKPRTDIWDSITHLELVREIYIQYEPKCWFEGYGKYMIKEEMPRRMSQLQLDPDVEMTFKAKLEQLLNPLN
jgi:glycosyltransferase involved in cell wall biosynthesis